MAPSPDPWQSIELRLATELVDALQSGVSCRVLLQTALPPLMEAAGATSGGLISQRAGLWKREEWIGPQLPLPEMLIGEALDRGTLRIADRWCVCPIQIGPPAGTATIEGSLSMALAIHLGGETDDSSTPLAENQLGRLRQAAPILAGAIERVESHRRDSRRIEQLSQVLTAAAEWQHLEDDDALLRRIADTATQLLDCERASIFLWDRRRKKLIGRPALGVEGGALEVADSAGVVGEVLSSGEPQIWNGGSDDESRVNRKVDKRLDFQTRSLVAVPMRNQRDALLGVFEAINHRGEGFESFDVAVLSDLASHAAVAIEALRTRRHLTETRDRLVDDAASATHLIGNHPAIENVRQSATKVAKTDLTVLILGKNGTGKEVVARHIHFESDRRSGPFVAVNCAALVESLLESELFGHEKGAFTDANQTTAGKFELASGGTLFLDEVGDMSPGGQAKLLRVLEEKVVVRVGGSQTIPVDVRVVAATNQPLEELIAAKRFREDLFFRLNVVRLILPSLADRGQDVLLLAEHFLEQFSYQIGRQIPKFSSEARQALLSYPWPGNVRELRNTMERVCYLCNDDQIEADDLMLSGSSLRLGGREQAITGTLGDATREFQIKHIDRAIEACNGNMTDAAARLGLHRSNLYRKMKQLGMPNSGDD